jgi:site-specific recombinase XerD
LDLLIGQDAGTVTPPNASATLAEVAREYLALREPNWGPHMVRAASNLVEKHLIAGSLGHRAIANLTESDLRAWLNDYVANGASKSLLKGLLLHTRAIFKLSRKKKITTENPTRISGPRAGRAYPGVIFRSRSVDA